MYNLLYLFISAAADEGLQNGGDLLELGTGPNLIPSTCASKRFRQIFLSDYSSNHRRLLEDWRQDIKSEQAADWSSFFDYIAYKEENNE